jgi:Fic family protein
MEKNGEILMSWKDEIRKRQVDKPSKVRNKDGLNQLEQIQEAIDIFKSKVRYYLSDMGDEDLVDKVIKSLEKHLKMMTEWDENFNYRASNPPYRGF